LILIATAIVYIFSVFIFSHFAGWTLVPKVCAIILTIVFIISSLKDNKPMVQISICHILFIFWMLIAVISGLLSENPKGNLTRAWTLCQVILVSIFLYGTILHRPNLNWFAWAFLIATTVSALGIDLGLMPHIPFQRVPMAVDSRFSATLGNPNIFGYVCVISLAFVIYLWRTHPKFLVRVLLMILAAYLTIKTADTGSRKAIFGLLLIFTAEYLFSVFAKGPKTRSKQALVLLIGGFILFLVGGSFIYLIMKGDYGHRMRNVGHILRGETLEKGEQSLPHRLKLYKTGWNLFLENPAFGGGLASFSETKIGHFRWGSIGTYSHSNFMEILVSSGLIGFIIYYSIYGIVVIRLVRIAISNSSIANTPSIHFLAVVIPFTIFFDFFAITYYVKEFWIVLTVILGLVKILMDKASLPWHENSVEADKPLIDLARS
jgi:O-antigen ligase